MTPVKNYQGRNESSVFIAFDFERFLDGHKTDLTYSSSLGTKLCSALNIILVFESRSRGLRRSADWHAVPQP